MLVPPFRSGTTPSPHKFSSSSMDKPIIDEPISLCVVGATGSVGASVLARAQRYPERYRVNALCARRSAKKLEELARVFKPRYVVLAEDSAARELDSQALPRGTKLMSGDNALCEVAALAEHDRVIIASVGIAALAPALASVRAQKLVILANKECLVAGGQVFRALTQEAESMPLILPADSEHNAVWQGLGADRLDMVEKIILTASGGPYLDKPDAMSRATPQQAVQHPNWRMGQKISTDSATLMNKGLELIEAYWLFGTEPQKLEAIIHPEQVVHALVRYRDGSELAGLAATDMGVPIASCLDWPSRHAHDTARLDWSQPRQLRFQPIDERQFPSFALAREALREIHDSRNYARGCVLNAANEEAVAAFLLGKIGLCDIPRLIEQAFNWSEQEGMSAMPCLSLDEVLHCHDETKRRARAAGLAA